MDERTIELMCRIADGIASQAEQEEMQMIADHNPEVAERLEEQESAAEAVGSVGLPEPGDEIREKYWGQVYNRIESRAGWMLVCAGLVLVIGVGVYEILTDPSIGAVYRIGFAALLVGTVLIFSGFLRVRMRQKRTDKYTEVKR